MEMCFPDAPFRGGFAALLWGVWSAGGFQPSAAESSLAQPRLRLPERSASRLDETAGKAWMSAQAFSACLAGPTGPALQFRHFVCPVLLPSPCLQHFGDSFIQI